MPGTFRDSSSHVEGVATSMAELCHRHGTTLSQAWQSFANVMKKVGKLHGNIFIRLQEGREETVPLVWGPDSPGRPDCRII